MKKISTIIAAITIIASTAFILIPPLSISGSELSEFGTGCSVNLPTSGEYNAMAVGDIDSDSNMDLAFGGNDYGSSNTHGLYVYTGNGDGTWTSISEGLPTVDSWGGVALADADQDGHMELYGANTWYNSYSGPDKGIGVWEYSSGSWSTDGISSPLSSGVANNLIVKDFIGDSGVDIAICSSKQPSFGLKVYSGSGSSPISWTGFSSGLPTSGQFTGIDIMDLNGDGLKDIVAAGYWSGTGMRIYLQTETGWNDVSSSLPSGAYSGDFCGVVCGDVNNDSHVDMVYADRSTGMEVLLGNSGGGGGSSFTWTTPTSSNGGLPTSATSGMFSQIDLADIDKDGDLDLLAPKESSGLHLYLGDGSTDPGTGFTFTEVTDLGLPTSGTYCGSAFLDFDSDGDLDIAGATWGSGIKIFETKFITGSAPVADAGDDQGVILGKTVTLDGTGSLDAEDCPSGDSVGTELAYDWSMISQPADSILTDADLSPSDSVAKPSFVPTHAGTHTLSLKVRDSDLGWSSVEDSVDIVVTKANTIPIADAGLDQTVYAGTTVFLNGSSSNDAEDEPDSLTFDWNVSADNPTTVTLPDESARIPSFTAPDVVGGYTFSLVVRDTSGAWSNEDTVLITIELPPNIKPTADAGPDRSGYINTTIHLDGSGSNDSDGSIVSWDWNCTSHPAVTINNENSSIPSFTPTSTGKYTFTLTVQDDRGGWADEDEMVVTIILVNKPPTADAGPDIEAYVNTQVHLNASASFDGEGSVTGWEWDCTSHIVNMLLSNSSAPSFIPEEVGVYTFTLRVMDDLYRWSENTDEVVVTVIETPNLKPVANAGADITAKIGEAVVLDGTNSFDEDGTITEWDWNCSSHPDVTINDENKAKLSFTGIEAGKFEFTLVVQDDRGAWSASDTVIVIIEQDESEYPDDDDNDDDDDSTSTGSSAFIMILPIVLGIVVVIATAVIIFLVLKKKKEKEPGKGQADEYDMEEQERGSDTTDNEKWDLEDGDLINWD